MEPVYLSKMLSQSNGWLSVRQSAVAQNVANANTPGYSARDVEPFVSVLDKTRLEMVATNEAHLAGGGRMPEASKVRKAESWTVSHSGNSVSLEQEMMKAGEITRAHTLNTSIAQSFHRMYLKSVR
ncbi:flagellar basal body rod protein FlgB [Roseibium aestuarii]|uniref:Flagellar basal body rod protein FlgB n=1 Tax=Roseibium aestuarii TaxID=2600299 RepID=A0ABW4JZZ6_9HYPH|nr:flagellar basal body rod protein FlgB [Roseibium aestuarii]